jgi:hypothetical protein
MIMCAAWWCFCEKKINCVVHSYFLFIFRGPEFSMLGIITKRCSQSLNMAAGPSTFSKLIILLLFSGVPFLERPNGARNQFLSRSRN